MKKLLIKSSGTLAPFRLINTVVVLARVAARYGIDAETLLARSGIEPSDLDNPDRIITITQEQSVAERFINRVAVPWIGLEVGREYHFAANGRLGMAVMCCETVIEALKLITDYIHLTGAYHRYTVYVNGDTGWARFEELIDLNIMRRFICEAEIASIVSMIRIGYETTAPVFREIHFAYPAPAYTDKYHETFGCPVFFGTPENKIVFDARHLSRPMLLANPLARTALEKECGQLVARLREQTSLSVRVQQELWACRNDGFPPLEQMASRIHLSGRTLRRRLEEEHTSYKTLQAEARKRMAMDLLMTTGLSMETIAARLGFSEASSFYRAFKSWTGRTPNTFREEK